jgi:hypothetical protein
MALEIGENCLLVGGGQRRHAGGVDLQLHRIDLKFPHRRRESRGLIGAMTGAAALGIQLFDGGAGFGEWFASAC